MHVNPAGGRGPSTQRKRRSNRPIRPCRRSAPSRSLHRAEGRSRHQLLLRTTPACRCLAVHTSSFLWTRRFLFVCLPAREPARYTAAITVTLHDSSLQSFRSSGLKAKASGLAARKNGKRSSPCNEYTHGTVAPSCAAGYPARPASNNARAGIIAGKSRTDCCGLVVGERLGSIDPPFFL